MGMSFYVRWLRHCHESLDTDLQYCDVLADEESIRSVLEIKDRLKDKRREFTVFGTVTLRSGLLVLLIYIYTWHSSLPLSNSAHSHSDELLGDRVQVIQTSMSAVLSSQKKKIDSFPIRIHGFVTRVEAMTSEEVGLGGACVNLNKYFLYGRREAGRVKCGLVDCPRISTGMETSYAIKISQTFQISILTVIKYKLFICFFTVTCIYLSDIASLYLHGSLDYRGYVGRIE